MSSSDNGWIPPADMYVHLLEVYRRKYISGQNSRFTEVAENYRLHYVAAHIKKAPRSIERMEYIVNHLVKERMLRS